jgi:RNA polymerase sigma-70 factor, ECF subfamily
MSGDRDLIERCLAGHLAAFDEIVGRYQDALYRHLLRLAGNREQAEDLCQEAFVKFYRALPSFDLTRPVAPFLFTIATNLWRDSRRPRLTLVTYEEVAATDPEPETAVLDLLARQAILAAMTGLREEYREVLSLRYDQGLSYREIAEVTGATTGTVGTWLRRAVGALREALQVAGKEAAR